MDTALVRQLRAQQHALSCSPRLQSEVLASGGSAGRPGRKASSVQAQQDPGKECSEDLRLRLAAHPQGAERCRGTAVNCIPADSRFAAFGYDQAMMLPREPKFLGSRQDSFHRIDSSSRFLEGKASSPPDQDKANVDNAGKSGSVLQASSALMMLRDDVSQKEGVRRLSRRKARQGGKDLVLASADALKVEKYVISRDNVPARLWWKGFNWFYQDWLGQENHGLQNLPLHQGMFFMASNHTSHLDCGATFIAAWAGGAKRVYALGARDYFFKNPFKAWFVTRIIGVIPFSRRGFSQQEIDILMRVKETSSPENPTAVLIFPEGTRSKTGKLGQFKAGVGLLAEQLGIPVVPVAVKGTLDSMPKGTLLPFRHKVRVEFGKPVEFQEVASPSSPAQQQDSQEAEESGDPGLAARDVERKARREAQKRFADNIRNSVLAMLRGYGQARAPAPPGSALHHHPSSLAQLWGGGKWNLIGWLVYWLPVSLAMVVAVGLAAAQVYPPTGAGVVGMAGRLGLGIESGGYAAVAGVFHNLQGAWQSSRVYVTLGIIAVAIYLKDFVQWLLPYVVLQCRED